MGPSWLFSCTDCAWEQNKRLVGRLQDIEVGLKRVLPSAPRRRTVMRSSQRLPASGLTGTSHCGGVPSGRSGSSSLGPHHAVMSSYSPRVHSAPSRGQFPADDGAVAESGQLPVSTPPWRNFKEPSLVLLQLGHQVAAACTTLSQTHRRAKKNVRLCLGVMCASSVC